MVECRKHHLSVLNFIMNSFKLNLNDNFFPLKLQRISKVSTGHSILIEESKSPAIRHIVRVL